MMGGADGRSEENREGMNWKLLWMKDQAYWKKRFLGSVKDWSEANEQYKPIWKCSFSLQFFSLSFSGEGSTNMSDGFIQNGILSGRWVTEERGQGFTVILGCGIQAR